MLQLLLFVLISSALGIYSRPFLKSWRRHGFFRFFAWEATLALVLLNAPNWFVEPWSPFQLISWVFLLASLLLLVHGLYLMKAVGRPEGELENTTNLVRVGAFKYIRHPLYSSLLCLAWGAFFKDVSAVSAFLVVAATILLFATARVEEAENLSRFGAAYQAYMRTTKMFVPYIV